MTYITLTLLRSPSQLQPSRGIVDRHDDTNTPPSLPLPRRPSAQCPRPLPRPDPPSFNVNAHAHAHKYPRPSSSVPLPIDSRSRTHIRQSSYSPCLRLSLCSRVPCLARRRCRHQVLRGQHARFQSVYIPVTRNSAYASFEGAASSPGPGGCLVGSRPRRTSTDTLLRPWRSAHGCSCREVLERRNLDVPRGIVPFGTMGFP